jgi:hypothetical protein
LLLLPLFLDLALLEDLELLLLTAPFPWVLLGLAVPFPSVLLELVAPLPVLVPLPVL